MGKKFSLSPKKLEKRRAKTQKMKEDVKLAIKVKYRSELLDRAKTLRRE